MGMPVGLAKLGGVRGLATRHYFPDRRELVANTRKYAEEVMRQARADLKRRKRP